jgi:hypothetical protein
MTKSTLLGLPSLDLEHVVGGFGMDSVGPQTKYFPGLGWQNTHTGRWVNPQNGGPANPGSRKP